MAGPPWPPSGGASFVLMMQTAEMGASHDTSHGGRLDGTREGRVFVQGEMGPRPVVIGEVPGEGPPQVPSIQDDQVVDGKASTICCAAQAAVGWAVTFQWSTRRLVCEITTSTDSTWNVAVGTVKKSSETRSDT